LGYRGKLSSCRKEKLRTAERTENNQGRVRRTEECLGRKEKVGTVRGTEETVMLERCGLFYFYFILKEKMNCVQVEDIIV
jgi:hypothetical protein